MLNIVVFNGGRGAATIIPEFVKEDGFHLTSIVNAYDDGKSTGEIRKLFRMLGPSDIRKVQQLMIPQNLPGYHDLQKLFRFRYGSGADRDACLREMRDFAENRSRKIGDSTIENDCIGKWLRIFVSSFLEHLPLLEKGSACRFCFSDCSVMNCIYAGAFQLFSRDFETVTLFFNKLFTLKGTVLPTNIEDKKLAAIRENGEVLYSEAEIVELRSNVRIKDLYILNEYPNKEHIEKLGLLERQQYLSALRSFVQATSNVIRAIQSADVIIYSPGTQHSSLYPSYLTRGIAEAIAGNTSANKIFICNIGEDYETPQYTASEYILGAYHYLTYHSGTHLRIADLIDYAIVNDRFTSRTEQYVRLDTEKLDRIGIHLEYGEFEHEDNPGKHCGRKILNTVLRLHEESFVGRLGREHP